jgi:hypothetical protein
MHILHKQRCRACGRKTLRPVIDLGPQYLQGSFVKPPHTPPPRRRIPTQLVRCDVSQDEGACGLLQLAHSIPPEILYANYWYRSGTNETMRGHLAGLMSSVQSIARPEHQRALDIGCNDGTGLGYISPDYERWGVDPSDIARELKPPINLINTVFPSDETRHLLRDVSFDIITSVAMFYDLEDPVGFACEVGSHLADAGIWVIEMSYMPLMLQTNSFDTICHEHLEYYSFSTLEYIIGKAGLRVFRIELNSINGGSIRCYACKKDCFEYDHPEWREQISRLRVKEFEMGLDTDEPYIAFQDRITSLRGEMTKLLGEIISSGQSIHIYGASTKGNVLLQWYGIDAQKIPYAADRNPDKVGARTLGTDIEIISEEQSRAMRPAYYLVLPWHFRREFLQRERETIMNGAKMIFPLPEISVIDCKNVDEAIATPEADRLAQFLKGR